MLRAGVNALVSRGCAKRSTSWRKAEPQDARRRGESPTTRREDNGTKNVGDFEALASAREIRPGVVSIAQADLTRAEQLALLRRIVLRLEEAGDLVNCTLRVAEDGTMSVEPSAH